MCGCESLLGADFDVEARDAGVADAVDAAPAPACSVGEVRCADDAQPGIEFCNNGYWALLTTCPDGELCDSSAPTPACAPMLPPCAGRSPGDRFCEGHDAMACGPDLVTAAVVESCPSVCSAGVCVPVEQVAAGGTHTCALLGDGTVRCRGQNDEGQLGRAEGYRSKDYLEAAPVEGLTDVIAISAGGWFNCALRADRTIWCWGDNSSGQLGDGTTETRYAPAPVLAAGGVDLGGIATIHTTPGGSGVKGAGACARLESGGVLCWGVGAGLHCDAKSSSPTTQPVAVDALADPLALATGYVDACIVGASHELACCGMDQFGNPNPDLVDWVPGLLAVPDLPNIAQVALGFYHVCVLDFAQQAWCWGYNSTGQLCTGDVTSTIESPEQREYLPQRAAGLDGATALALGQTTTCAIRGSDGAVECCGPGSAIAAPIQYVYPEPRLVLGPARTGHAAVQISLGRGHGCATLGDGTSWCWGNLTASEGGPLLNDPEQIRW